MEKSGRPIEYVEANRREEKQHPIGCEIYFEAFYELDTCRPPGMEGIFPIPFTAILQYCMLNGYDEETTHSLCEIIRAMDSFYLKQKNKELKAKQPPATSGSTSNKSRKITGG